MSERASPPDLLFVIGAPAVGKMAVGHEIARRTGFRLLHNHMTIEPILRIFDWGTPQFSRLVELFRMRILEEVAASDLPGLVFTFVWAFNLPEEAEATRRYAEPFRTAGSRILWLELEAAEEERLRRNETEFRLSEKPSKRDVAETRRRMLEHDTSHRFSSEGELNDEPHYVRIDNTDLEPDVVAEMAIDALQLPRSADPR